jgi:predicted exporter
LRLVEQFEACQARVQDGVWFSKDGKRALLVAQPGLRVTTSMRRTRGR